FPSSSGCATPMTRSWCRTKNSSRRRAFRRPRQLLPLPLPHRPRERRPGSWQADWPCAFAMSNAAPSFELSVRQDPRRVFALLASLAVLAVQIFALADLMQRHLNSLVPEAAYVAPLAHEPLARAVEQTGFHLAGTVLLVLLQLALWTPRWPRDIARTALRGA